MRGAEVGEGDAQIIIKIFEIDIVAVNITDVKKWYFCGFCHSDKRVRRSRSCYYVEILRLRENTLNDSLRFCIDLVAITPVSYRLDIVKVGSQVAGQRHFSNGDQYTSVGNVMNSVHCSSINSCSYKFGSLSAALEVNLRRSTGFLPMDFAQPE